MAMVDTGLMWWSFNYLMAAGGAMTEEDYTYHDFQSKCRFDASKVSPMMVA
jgi:papain like protease